MHEPNHLFIDLQPPPGGLQRLQRTIDHRTGSMRLSVWRLAAGAFAMSLLALAWLLPGVMVRHRQTGALVSAMRSAVAPPVNGIEIGNGAAIELPSGQANVRLYLVQSSAPATPTPEN